MAVPSEDIKVNEEIAKKNAELFKSAFAQPTGLQGDPYSKEGYFGRKDPRSESNIQILRIILHPHNSRDLETKLKAKNILHRFDGGAGSDRLPFVELDCSQENIDFTELFSILGDNLPQPLKNQLLRDIYFYSVFGPTWVDYLQDPSKIFVLFKGRRLPDEVFQNLKTYMKEKNLLKYFGWLLKNDIRYPDNIQRTQQALEAFSEVSIDNKAAFQDAQNNVGEILEMLADAEERAGKEVTQVKTHLHAALAHFLRAGNQLYADGLYKRLGLAKPPQESDVCAEAKVPSNVPTITASASGSRMLFSDAANAAHSYSMSGEEAATATVASSSSNGASASWFSSVQG